MQASTLAVVRYGPRWAVAADGEVMAFTRRKQDATRLAEEAAETLRASGAVAEVQRAPRERRSFRRE
ncbi:hypothetical protein [Phenylobacterium sp.]|uniref:hypothetical protein n=1 Tax=Phenylobacterium sp. TaxID=1871053 RepID=UPI002DF0CCBE|nr:hypothetical protein [Phenylobacterium sp.]